MGQSRTGKKTFVPRYRSSAPKDPNAMDVDMVNISQLTPEEQTWHMKEGRCFRCHKTGHIASDHEGNALFVKKQGTSTQKFDKKTAHTTRAMIRNLVADLEEEEKKKMFEGMLEDADF